MKYYISSKNFSAPRQPVEVDDETRVHDASPSAKVRLIWLKSDSTFPCGVIFPRAARVVWAKEAIEKVLGIKYLIGKGGQFDPDGQYRIAKTSIDNAVRERSKAYHRFMARQRQSHKMVIPPELLQ